MQYLEIYGADVMNPELAGVIELAADRLVGSDEPFDDTDVTSSGDSPSPIDGDFNEDGCVDGSDADGLASTPSR